MKRHLRLLLATVLVTLPAWATEYRTVEVPTVLYDAPSQKGRKLFVIKRNTPVELIVVLEAWIKVRDAEGGLAWIEKKYLSDRRSLIVTANYAEVRQGPDETTAVIFEVAKGVALDYLETLPGGWVKVHHRDGQTGFVRANQVWGL